MISPSDIEAFERDGFLHLKNVFSASEVARISELGRSHPGTENAGTSLLLIPELAGLLKDDRLLAVAHGVLGSPASFFLEANYVHYRFASGTRHQGHLHHDGKGAPGHLFNRLNQPFTVPYPVIRFGIYLQDTATQSGGLKICPGSHLQDTSTFSGKEHIFYDIPSQPGDVICFCLRLLHSPFALRRRQSPGKALAPWDEDAQFAIQPNDFLPLPEQRESIFIDFAAIQPLADLHIKSRALHPSNKKPGLANFLKNGGMQVLSELKDLNIRYDYAVVDNLHEVRRHIVDGKINPTGIPYLEQLLLLCSKNSEYSQEFPFTPSLAEGNYSLSDAVEVFNLLTKRYVTYSKSLASASRDTHMGAGYRPDAGG